MARPAKRIDLNQLGKLLAEPGGHPRNRASADGDAPTANLPRGEWTRRGVFRMEYSVPYGKKFGARIFANPEKDASLLKPWGAAPASVFLDLETTGLSGGAGTYAFLIGLGFCGADSFKVIQLFLSGPGWEKNWLSAIESELPEKDFGFVTYNGACFDMPLLRARHTLARAVPSWNAALHMDLLPLARHFYRKRLLSCSLSSVESNVLGVRRSGEDIPGREIPQIYSDFLRTRDAAPLHGVFYHNRLDIVSLAALQVKISELVAMENCSGEDLVRCGDLWYIMGRTEEARGAWETAMEHEDGICGANLRLAEQSKRGGDFENAKKHFKLALEYDRQPLETLENLAKLEEHRFGDYEAALGYAERALSWLDSRRGLRDKDWMLQRQGVKHRVDRLKRKIAENKRK